jgi:TIR domain
MTDSLSSLEPKLRDSWNHAEYRSRLFEFDVFISHSRKAGLGSLVDHLEALGVRLWWDHDKLIRHRRAQQVIQRALTHCRVILIVMSDDYLHSPWTAMEAEASVRSEHESQYHRVVLYDPNDSGDRSWQLNFVARLCDIIGKKCLRETLFTKGELAELVQHVIQANRISRGHRTALNRHFRISQALGRRIARAQQASSHPADDAAREDDFHQFVRRTSHKLLSGISSGKWRQDKTRGFEYDVFVFRNVLAHPADDALKDCVETDVSAVTVLCQALLRSEVTDNRANALMMLHSIALHRPGRYAVRILAAALRAEPDPAVAQTVLTDDDVVRFRGKLHACEMSELHQPPRRKFVPGRDRLLGGPVTLRCNSTTVRFEISRLPPAYAIRLDLHWMRMLCDDIRARASTGSSWNSSDEIEMELACRSLNENAVRLYERAQLSAPGDQEAISEIADTFAEVVATSEAHDGAPLRAFACYFVDHMLPLLGVIAIYGDPLRDSSVAQRCIRLLRSTSYGHEVGAYEAYLDRCTRWRSSQGKRIDAQHGPVSVWHHGFSCSPYLRLPLQQDRSQVLDIDEDGGG